MFVQYVIYNKDISRFIDINQIYEVNIQTEELLAIQTTKWGTLGFEKKYFKELDERICVILYSVDSSF